jgi:lipoprotein-releasing system ATP-binding protein
VALLEARGIAKVYKDSEIPVEVLKGIDISLNEGEVVGVLGASGSGKSTLLHILGGLDKPSAGNVMFDGMDISKLSSDELARFRNKSVGFVFQFYHLLPEFTALENAMLPGLIAGRSRSDAKKDAVEALEEMGLSDRLDHRPALLSGGEQQRVALARAAVLRPPMILADEPTGNLDRENGDKVWHYLMNLNRDHGVAMMVVTHNSDLSSEIPKNYMLDGGELRAVAG